MHEHEDAKPRRLPAHDHRRLGAELDLFSFPAEAPGQVLWHRHGLHIFERMRALVSAVIAGDYQEVRSPQLWHRAVWQRSGHLEKFGGLAFCGEDDELGLKPVSCPGHCLHFGSRPRSYRELPLRLAEVGHCYRNEASGALHGLMRLRAFHQDDGHVFCADEQVGEEVASCLQAALRIYRLFGLEPSAELALRPAVRHGDDALWDRAEQQLASAIERSGLPFARRDGEGAFYGPKIDLHVEDGSGRRWQLGTIQVDYVMPQRFELSVAGDGSRPVLVHRALLGSFERFIGVLLERCGGRLPVWLSPRQVVVLPVGAGQVDDAASVRDELLQLGVRAELAADGSLAARIRAAQGMKVSYLAVVGERERAAGLVSVRRGGEVESEAVPRPAFHELLARERVLPFGV